MPLRDNPIHTLVSPPRGDLVIAPSMLSQLQSKPFTSS